MMTQHTGKNMLVYIGTYTRKEPHVLGKSEGVYIGRFDPAVGTLEVVGKAPGIDNPSYVVLHPSGRYLYAANEVGDFEGQSSGAISALAIDLATGALTLLNQQATHGSAPCHLCVDQTGRFVLAANYGGGSVAVLPVQTDGRLGEASDFIQHQGSSVNPRRQGEPHAHSVNLDPANRRAFVADLGMDKIMIYRLDLEQGKLSPNDPPWAQVQAGAGPRHFAFHPNGQYAYVINELDSTMTAFTYDDASGGLTELQTVPTLPDDFSGTSHCADVHVHPSGKFVYGSNRGHDSIAIFTVDQASGKLQPAGYEPTQGKVPRNFAIDPTGAYLLAANQNSDNIVIFEIDQETGRLSPTGQTALVPTPVCIKLLA
jgi:6-phosphogluconolactonase